jgi:hypothetical protein
MIYAYIQLSDSEYPVFEGILRLRFPNITENQTGETLPCPEGYAPVYETELPALDEALFALVEKPPKQINSVWKRQWGYRELTAEERLGKAKRRQQNLDGYLYVELNRAKEIAGVEHSAQQDWKDYVVKLEAWLDEFPRVNPKPVMARNVQMLDNAGSAPDVIG